ncbi:molybdopterin-dependent oxidoreductase [Marinivivus vitaminiproducens]|uniref:molybdopterin-dependent oxidoreductase n=1 Tax=Marinivivus vitaminiproducens TaxID=3035935 RepID=UPI0027A80607|nr:molybdopterin-dependent oxidoreductase [Geminicoccaceae bacterium SCSIO 64248]
MSSEIIKGYCTLCRSRCGTVNTVRDGKLVSVAADREHPTGQATCAKGRAAPELVHHPDRLLHPMKRTRPKGAADPGWVRISWDEALDTIAERLTRFRDESGAESVAFEVTTPSGTSISDSIDWIERFIRIYGSPNTIYGTEICNWHKDVAHAFTFGCGMPMADYAHADLAVLWGHNPANVWLAQAGKVADGTRRTTRLLVVDPRETAHAREADVWLRVRPGTDAALALGLIRWMVRNAAYDEAFVRRWTNAAFLVDAATGFFIDAGEVVPGATGYLVHDDVRGRIRPVDPASAVPIDALDAATLVGEVAVTTLDGRRLAARPAFHHLVEASAPYDPPTVQRETGIAPADLERAARLIAQAGPRVAYHSWTGIGQHANASQTERALAILYALTGSFDREGGNRIYGPLPQAKINGFDLLAEPQRQKALGLDQRPLGPPLTGWVLAKDVYRAILEGAPYRVRGLVGFGGNLLMSHPGAARGVEALRRLEFHVHCDLFHTPTNAFADILLPVSSAWEHEGLRLGFEIGVEAAGHAQLRPQMVPRRGEARPDYAVVLDLARRMNLGDSLLEGDIEAGWNHMLVPSGIDVATLRRHPGGLTLPVDAAPGKYARTDADGVANGFSTPTRRVEIYSERLLRHGYPPVPVHIPPKAADDHLPLTLVTAKTGYYCHSQHRNLASLRQRAGEPFVTLHPKLAERKGLIEGDLCSITTGIGRVAMRLALSSAQDETVVVAEYGWWQACPDLGLPGYPVTGPASVNTNAIIGDDRIDPLSGALPLRSVRCDVTRHATRAVRPWSGWRSFIVASLEQESGDARSIVLEPTDGGPLPGFRPGQHVVLRHPEEPETTRAYSLSGAASDDAQSSYRITVKRQVALAQPQPRIGGSHVSDHLNRKLGVGQTLWLRAPSGRFVLPLRHTQPLVLIAAGIGITPFMGYLETLAAQAPEAMPEITLIYGNRDGRNHAFKARIESLRRTLPRLRVIRLYSAPRPEDSPGRDFDQRGRIGARLIESDWIERQARFFLCGPAAMMTDMREALEERGVLPFEIRSEVFKSPVRIVAQGDVRRRIAFRRSGVVMDWTPDSGSVLDAAERQGIALASGCRVGQCESCVVRLLEGQATQPEDLQELDEGCYLSCQMVPLSDLVLDA